MSKLAVYAIHRSIGAKLMHLTAQQKNFFDTFGFLHFPGLFADSIDSIITEFEALWTARGGGHAGQPHNGKARSTMVQFVDQREKLSALLDDPRLHDVAV